MEFKSNILEKINTLADIKEACAEKPLSLEPGSGFGGSAGSHPSRESLCFCPRGLWLLLLGVCSPWRFLKPSEVVGGSQPSAKETTEYFPSIYLVILGKNESIK